MSQFNSQSGRIGGVRDGDVPPNLKEEQEDENYISSQCDASLHSEENSPSQVISSLPSETQFTPKNRPA